MRPHQLLCLHPSDDGSVCGASNPPGVRVCVNYECRARFNVCKRCGTLNRFSARFCRSCGLTLPVLWDLEWPDLGGGTGHLGSSEDPLDFPLVAKWRWPRGDRERTERFVASAVVYKGLVYAASLGGSVFALDQYSGELRGESEAGSPISVTPVVADRELWLVTQGGDLCVMDGRVGGQAQESERLSDGPLSGCVVFDDVVVVASADGRIMAVKRGSISKTCWAWPRDGSRMAGGVPGGIAASGDVVVVATGSGEVVAISRDGEPLWQRRAFDEPASVTAPPAVGHGCVFVCERGGQCAALRLSDGERMWHDMRVRGPLYAGPAVSDRAVFVASGGGTVSELDARTGARRRDVDLNDEHRPCWCGRRFTGCAAPPTCTPKYVLFGTSSWRVYAWRRGTSRVAKVLETDGPVFSAPAVSDGHVYVTGWDGTVWAVATPEA